MLQERLEQLVDAAVAAINAVKTTIFGADPQPLTAVLTTQDRSSLVAALNEITQRVEVLENRPQ